VRVLASPHAVLGGLAATPHRARSLVGRTFRSLRVRNYRLWFVGQTISTTGTWMQSVAQSWLVLKLTGSAVDLGITVALQFGPVLFLGPWGGVIADRFDKRRVLIATQSAFMLQAAVLGVLVGTGVVQVWMVWSLALLMGLINAADNPSRQAFAVEMVGREDLANAVALNSVVINSSRIVGPAIAALLIGSLGLAVVFFLNAASFVAVIGGLLAMDASLLHRSAPAPRARGQIRAGLAYAWRTWELRLPLVLMAVVSTVGYNFSVILPLLAKHTFHAGIGAYGALATAMGVGALGGALLAATRRRPSFRLLVGATVLFGGFSMLVAFAPTLELALLLLVPMGATGIVFVATTNSLLQLHSTATMRGRVMSLWAVVFLGSTPIGGPLTGVVAAHLGVRAALALGGAATVAAATWAGFGLRRLRRRGAAGAGPHQARGPEETSPALARTRAPASGSDRS
jgi:MFS family permease